MDVEKIIYNTARNLYNLEDKLSIATLFIFCYKVGSIKFAELLYSENHIKLIKSLNKEYSNYEIDFKIDLSRKDVKDAFEKTIVEVKKKYDKDGFYKAVFEKDPYALTIINMVSTNFKK